MTKFNFLNKLTEIHNTKPLKIISLVPSISELLFDLGLEKEVVGITKFCIHPNQWFNNKTKVGGTKKINFNVINNLNPTLIIANKEENTKDEIKKLALQYPVLVTEINSYNQSLKAIKQIGEITNTTLATNNIISKIKFEFNAIKKTVKTECLYFIWQKPYMLVGKNTFINSMLQHAGFKNLITENRYPILTIEEIIALQPSLVFLSSEPFPFKRKHKIELQKLLPFAKIILVDGEIFSWYGSRMLKAPKYFTTLHTTIQSIND